MHCKVLEQLHEIELITVHVDGLTLIGKKDDSININGKQIIFSAPEKPLPKETVTIALPAGTKLYATIHFSTKVFTIVVPKQTLCEIPNDAVVNIGKTQTLISSSDVKTDTPKIKYNISFPKGTMLAIEDKIKKVSSALFKTIVMTPGTKIILLPETFTFVKSDGIIFRSKTDEEQEAITYQ
jgi:hypothetical protein